MATGGDIELKYFSLNHSSARPVAAVAGGNIDVTSGSIYGDAYYGGDYIASNVWRSDEIHHDTPIDFEQARWDLTYLSAKAAAQEANRS